MMEPYALIIRDDGDNPPIAIGALSSERYAAINRASSWIYRAESDRTLVETVRASYRTFRQQLRFCRDHSLNLVLVQARVNAALGGYLSATRTFADQIGRIAFEGHPDYEQLSKRLRIEQRRHFDTAFAYRFLSRFRNYVQHCGYPHSLVLSKVLVGTKDPAGMRLRTQFFVSPHTLLERYDGWGPVAADLASMQRRIKVAPLVKEMTDRILEIDVFVQQLVLPMMLDSRRLLLSILPADWRAGGYSVVLLEELTCEPDGMNRVHPKSFKKSPLPTHILGQIEHWPDEMPVEVETDK